MAKRRTLERWPVEPTRQEALLLKRLNRTKKLFHFLREHRHELFDDAGWPPAPAGKPLSPAPWLDCLGPRLRPIDRYGDCLDGDTEK